MSQGGFFKVYRKAYDTIFARGPETWAVFSWLMFHAEWAGSGVGTARCTAGEIAADCQLTRSQVRRILDWLEERGTVEVEARLGRGFGMTVLLVNWERYQAAAPKRSKSEPKPEPKRGVQIEHDPANPRPRD